MRCLASSLLLKNSASLPHSAKKENSESERYISMPWVWQATPIHTRFARAFSPGSEALTCIQMLTLAQRHVCRVGGTPRGRSPTVRVSAAKADPKTAKGPSGFRFDGTMMRWVRWAVVSVGWWSGWWVASGLQSTTEWLGLLGALIPQVRDDRVKGQLPMESVLIQPKSGPAYTVSVRVLLIFVRGDIRMHPRVLSHFVWTWHQSIATSQVWPVVHTDLNKRGLKSVSPKEVSVWAIDEWADAIMHRYAAGDAISGTVHY